MNNVPTNTVEKILHLQQRTDALRHKINATTEAIALADEPSPFFKTTEELEDLKFNLKLDRDRRVALLRVLNDLLRDNGIYPYHDGTVWQLRPFNLPCGGKFHITAATLEPSSD